jgi:Tfp pilus assembly protein PilO
MKPMRSAHSRTWIGIVLLGVAAVVLFGAALYSLLETQLQRVDLAAEQQRLDAGLTRLAHLESLAANEAQTRRTIEEYELLLPRGVNQDRVFATVEELCDRYGVTVTQMAFEKIEAQGDVKKLPVSIAVQGNYGDVMAMLEELTQEGRLTLLDSMTLHAQIAAEGIVAAQASASIYFH